MLLISFMYCIDFIEKTEETLSGGSPLPYVLVCFCLLLASFCARLLYTKGSKASGLLNVDNLIWRIWKYYCVNKLLRESLILWGKFSIIIGDE